MKQLPVYIAIALLLAVAIIIGVAKHNSNQVEKNAVIAAAAREVGLSGYEDSVAEHPNDPQARLKLADWYIVTGKPTLAISQLRSAVELQPKNDELKYMLADALQLNGNSEESRKILTDLTTHPNKICQYCKE